MGCRISMKCYRWNPPVAVDCTGSMTAKVWGHGRPMSSRNFFMKLGMVTPDMYTYKFYKLQPNLLRNKWMALPRRWAIIGYIGFVYIWDFDSYLFTFGFLANHRAVFHSLPSFTSWLTAIGRHQCRGFCNCVKMMSWEYLCHLFHIRHKFLETQSLEDVGKPHVKLASMLKSFQVTTSKFQHTTNLLL